MSALVDLPRGGDEPLLVVDGLTTVFDTEAGTVGAVEGASFALRAGETLALVGESGCGKSVTALSILRLVDAPGRVAAGRVLLRGRDLLALPEGDMRRVRGREVAMVFQEPSRALNPVLTVGEQVAEALRLHLGLDRRAARERTVELFRRVGLADPERRYGEHPHRLSGGMRQRVVIAMAVACDPALLLADEPTTALDVTVQAQILALLRELREERGMGMLLVTHDLGVVAETADRVAVLYAGRVVETAGVEELFARPRHPYTAGLLRSLPDPARPGAPLVAIPGTVPGPLSRPTGCRFRDRCPLARERCAEEEPELAPVPGAREHAAACHFPDEVAEAWRTVP